MSDTPKITDYTNLTVRQYNGMTKLIDEGTSDVNKNGVYYCFFKDLDGKKYKVRHVLDPDK